MLGHHTVALAEDIFALRQGRADLRRVLRDHAIALAEDILALLQARADLRRVLRDDAVALAEFICSLDLGRADLGCVLRSRSVPLAELLLARGLLRRFLKGLVGRGEDSCSRERDDGDEGSRNDEGKGTLGRLLDLPSAG